MGHRQDRRGVPSIEEEKGQLVEPLSQSLRPFCSAGFVGVSLIILFTFGTPCTILLCPTLGHFRGNVDSSEKMFKALRAREWYSSLSLKWQSVDS